jgi:hypothetical protein
MSKALSDSVAQRPLLDFAANASLNGVRNALAKAEYLGLLEVRAVEAVLGQGRPGTAKLRQALQRHQPRLADTRSRTERRFLQLCEDAGTAANRSRTTARR